METLAWMVAVWCGLLLAFVVYVMIDGRGSNDGRDWAVFVSVGGACVVALAQAAGVLLGF